MKLRDVLRIYGVLLFFPASAYPQDDIWVPSDHPAFTYPEYENVWAVSFIDSVNGWALVHGVDPPSTEMRRILHTTDGGRTWTLRYQDTEALFYGIHFINETHGWLSGSGKASITTDGGFTWRQSTFNNVFAYDGFDVFFVDSLNGWICCAGGWIYHSSDGGLTWEEQHSGTIVWLQEIHFLTPELGYAAGTNESYGSDIIKTTDGGKHWERSFYTTAQILDMHVIDSLNIWVPGRNGAVFNTTDGGIHWNEHFIVGGHPLSCISFKDSRFGWVGAADGFTSYTLDGGETWLPQPVSKFQGFQDIAVLGRETACIVGWGSVFLHYNGSGKPTILDVTDTVANTKEFYVSTIHSVGRPSPKYTLLEGPDNMKMDALSGLLSWQAPGIKDTGAYHITVGAENPAGIDELGFTLHLKYVNHPPQINVSPQNPIIETSVHTTIIFRAYSIDIDEDTLSSKWLVNQISYPDSVDSSGVHYFMFTPDSAGNYTLSFVTSDKEFISEFTWTVNVRNVDVFPLSPGRKYTYSYQYEYRSYWVNMLDQLVADSGVVVYTVQDSESLSDTAVTWSVQETSTLWHKRFYSGGDTISWPASRDTTGELVESFAGLHSLRCSLLIWSFPCRYPEKDVFRYANTSELFLTGDYLPPGPPRAYGYDSLWFSTIRGFYRQNRYYHGEAIGIYNEILSVHLLEGPPSEVQAMNSIMPQKIALLQNFPNPFNPTTTIQYALPHRSHVMLAVYNTLGQQVATLLNGEIEAGNHEVQLNASSLASGVYFYRLQTPGFVQTRKLLLVR